MRKNSAERAKTAEPTPTPVTRRGISEVIPEAVKATIQGKSMNNGASITDLYLPARASSQITLSDGLLI